MKIGSLFSGIGGLELGLERAGVGHTVWQVEKDDYCRRVLARHWPDAVRYEDVTTVDWSAVESVDVICGGFPCQPFSVAGLRKGVFDERWGWPWFEDAVRLVGPSIVVVENVPALLRDPVAFGLVLGGLHQLGFDAEWSIVSAASVGALHLRRRLFVVAYTRSEGPQGLHDASWQEHLRSTEGPSRRQWSPEPAVARVANGVPGGVDSRIARTRALGNAVVPQVAEVVGRRLLDLIDQGEAA